ncbi:MAG: hemolysin III family protein [Clostridia bacterium]|nr:hemolysin III family protein [Clostridia bacterium]NCC75308.1 hemolysin III family protein [Clostridia bacterium]
MEKTRPARLYTFAEELFNSITHGIGALLSIAALVILVVIAARRRDALAMVSFAIYGSSLLLLYLSSTLYHSLTAPRAKAVFRVLDHASINLLIAGSYTPITLLALTPGWGWSLFGVVWGLAILGVLLNVAGLEKTRRISMALYVLMGWLVIVALRPMLAMVPAGLLIFLLAGGLFYTVGILFYAVKKIPFNHGIWHLFVLGGSICHFAGFLLYLT